MTLKQLNEWAKAHNADDVIIKALDEDGDAWTNAVLEYTEENAEGEYTVYLQGE